MSNYTIPYIMVLILTTLFHTDLVIEGHSNFYRTDTYLDLNDSVRILSKRGNKSRGRDC